MFDTYSDIFDQRGSLYHQAMLEHPFARQREFEAGLSLLELHSDLTVCDIPSGGGYLQKFISVPDIKVYSVETSEAFAQKTRNLTNNTTLLCEDITDLPLVDGQVDRIISLAGLHHVASQMSFYREAYRILAPDGIFVLGDVQSESGVDHFLNHFVDQHSSMGHKGIFLSRNTLNDLEHCGFKIISSEVKSYSWKFSSTDEMVAYCQMLFGIDKADKHTILKGIQTHLGYELTESYCYMNWELLFIKSIKDTDIK